MTISKPPVIFHVFGEPRSKGSWKAYKTGGKVSFVPHSARAKQYQEHVTQLATQAWPHEKLPLGVDVGIEIIAHMRRPVHHFVGRRRENEGTIRDKFKTVIHANKKPDVDKVMRLVLDALTGVVYTDDQQVVYARIERRWADAEPFLTVCILHELEEVPHEEIPGSIAHPSRQKPR